MPKVCIHCGKDCSHVPRVRDPQGRYACRACLDALAAGGAQPGAHAGAEPLPAALVDQVLASPIAIADPVESPAPRRACPACAHSLAPDAVVCTQCGYDTRKGFQAGTGVGADSRKGGITKCPSCGYSLKGLRTNVCPECGKTARPKSREQAHTEASRQTVIAAYRNPALMFVFGTAVALIATAVFANRFGFDPERSVKIELVAIIISIPAGVAAYFIAGALWMGFNAPLHLLALQFAGVYAVTAAATQCVEAIAPLGIISFGVSAVVFFGLLMQVLELDFEDAFMVWLITWGTSIAMVELLGPPLLRLLGI